MKNLVSAGIALLLAGCTMTLHELRQEVPARTAVIADRQYDVLAGCVVEGLETAPSADGLAIQANHRADKRRSTITAVMPPTLVGPAWPMLDLILTQRDGAVLVESRPGDWSGATGGLPATRRLQAEAWPIIERCAGTTLAETAK